MIFAASWKEPGYQHGNLIQVSFSKPPHLPVYDKLKFFIPGSYQRQFNAREISQEEYINLFKQQCLDNWEQIATWLEFISPKLDLTLCSWQSSEKFNHRDLILKIVQRHRPECFGGARIPRRLKHFATSNQ